MRLFRDEDGQTLVFTALLACCLMGFMALAIDAGVLFRAQRKLQTAADAAAIAGALEYYYNGAANISSAAKTAASNNGVTDPNQVTVTPGPTNGWHTGAAYVEVIIRQPNPTIFMGTFSALFPGGSATSFNPMTVATRAVAGIVPSSACNHILNPSSAGSLTLQGGATVSSPHCGWQVDSTSPEALCITGNNALKGFSSAGVSLTVSQQTAQNCNQLYPGTQVTGTSQAGDPLANRVTFPDPTQSKYCDTSSTGNVVTDAVITNSTTIKSKSVNTGGFSTSANPLTYDVTCFSAANVTLSGVTLGSTSSENHLYIFENGMQLSGNVSIYGTTDLNGGNFCQGSVGSNGKCSFNNNAFLSMYAPANDTNNTYAWNGLAFIVPGVGAPAGANTAPYCDNSYKGPNYSASGLPDSCLQMQFGSGGGNLDGMIYAPSAALYFQDNGGGTQVTGLIVDSLDVNSKLTITDSYPFAHPESPLNQVQLVE